MNTFSAYIKEGVAPVGGFQLYSSNWWKSTPKPKKLAKAPIQFANLEDAASKQAARLRCALEKYPKEEQKWIETIRFKWLVHVWDSCLKSVRSTGFDIRDMNDYIEHMDPVEYPNSKNGIDAFRVKYKDLKHSAMVEYVAPDRWRRAVADWMADQMKKNEDAWLKALYKPEEIKAKEPSWAERLYGYGG